MACTVEIKDLWDEMARLISDNKKDSMMGVLAAENEYHHGMAELLGEVACLKRHLCRYERTPTLPDHATTCYRKRKRRWRGRPRQTRRQRRRAAEVHVDILHNRTSVRTVRDAAEKCKNCDNEMISKMGEPTKQVTDLPHIS